MFALFTSCPDSDQCLPMSLGRMVKQAGNAFLSCSKQFYIGLHVKAAWS